MAPKPKPSPPPAPPADADSPPSIEELFSAMNTHIVNSQPLRVIKIADQVLAALPGDEDALRCKVVAMLKLDKIEETLGVIDAAGRFPVNLKAYKAYCLYRQNKLHEALQVLDGEERDPMVLQVESQILYRLLRIDECMENYMKLQSSMPESVDLKTNIIGALVIAGKAGEVKGTMDTMKVKPSKSSDLAYNTACSLIEMKKYADAEQQLLAARRIGQEELLSEEGSEGYTEDDIDAELAPIDVQLAYVQQMLGHTEESIEAYIGILKRDLSDASSAAVATNNLIALKSTKDTSNSLKRLDGVIGRDERTGRFQLADGLDFKLIPRQKEALYCNLLLLLLQANKLDQAQDLVSELPDLFPDSVTPVLLQAALLVRQKRVSKAEEILGQFADKFPQKSKPVLLARAQIAATVGHLPISAESLSKSAEIQHTPAAVATIVALRERSGDIDSAAAALDAAIQWWKNSMTEQNKLDLFLMEAASFKLNHGRHAEASELYEELAKRNNSIEALAGIVTTVAHTDIEKAELYEKRLTPLPGLKGINVESLEKTSGAKPIAGVKMTKAEVPEVSEEAKKAKAKKRKRKPRYPKGFDPANPGPPPDPERWLPKRERSTYRPKRKDKRVQVRGSQGSMTRDKHEASANAPGSSGGGNNTKAGQGNATTSKGPPQKATNSKSRKKSRN